MSVAVRTSQEGNQASLVLSGPFDLAHATEVAQAVEKAAERLSGCRSVDVDLAQLDRIDGTGAVLLARLLDRLAEEGRATHVQESQNPEAVRLIELYREHRTEGPAFDASGLSLLARIGTFAAELPFRAGVALDFIGRCATALPRAVASPSSVDWRSLPRLFQEIGADALLVTGAANLLIGAIIGFLNVTQLGQFGELSLVPKLVVVSHFRELGPLVTAMIVAGRSGAGLASEIGTMQVTEEIDALRSMGFNPVRWLVVPRCLALIVTLPLLTWVGDALAPLGGLMATTVVSSMTARAYILLTMEQITPANLLVGLVRTPFLALVIGLIACGQGLLTRGGAAAVGRRTTAAVVQALLCVILISVVFTFLFSLMGV